MQTLSDLSELDHAQKDALIRLLWAQVQVMQATIVSACQCKREWFTDVVVAFVKRPISGKEHLNPPWSTTVNAQVLKLNKIDFCAHK